MKSRRLAVIAALAVLAAGCSGGGSSDSTPAPTDSTPLTVTADTSPDTSPDSSPDTTTPAPSTTAAPGPVLPLTGLPVTDDRVAQRPAMVVKIDNNAKARPQSGLDAADIVFEEIVEIQTRFAAVFHSEGADPVGPIRSGRTQDIDLLGSYDQPLFVWSGGNRNVTRAIDDSDLVSISAASNATYGAAGFFRGSQHKKPHNLYAQSSLVWELAPDGAGPPPQQFQYLGAGQEPAGEPASGVAGEMDGLSVEWTFDPGSGLYARTNGGVAHLDELGGPVTTANVVVLAVQYRPSEADARSPEAQTLGTGDAMVFTGGNVVEGTWTRSDRSQPFALSDQSGGAILLTPGRSWVELARAETFTAIP